MKGFWNPRRTRRGTKKDRKTVRKPAKQEKGRLFPLRSWAAGFLIRFRLSSCPFVSFVDSRPFGSAFIGVHRQSQHRSVPLERSLAATIAFAFFTPGVPAAAQSPTGTSE